MTPGKYNMVCPQGSTLSQELTYSINSVNVDLSGYSARMQVREKHTSKNVIISFTTENEGIVLGGESGTITINASSEETSNFAAKEYVYDLEIISSSNIVTRLVEGKFIVTPEVTR